MAVAGRVGPQTYADNISPSDGIRLGNAGETIVGNLHGRHYEQANRSNIYPAHAIIVAPVIFSTAAGTGGPLLWNGSTTHKASILAVGWGLTVTTTVVAVLGLTGNTGQTAAPGSTTAIDSVRNCYIGGGAPACTAFRVGTPSSAGNFFVPFGDALTGAITTRIGSMNWVDLGGMFVLPPFTWISVAASATATTLAGNFSMIWEEIPI